MEQNRAILDSMREGVVAINADGCVTLANNEALRLLRCMPNIIGKPVGRGDSQFALADCNQNRKSRI